MTFWQLVLHLFHFALPALAMAMLMPLAGRTVMGAGRISLRRRMGVHALSAGRVVDHTDRVVQHQCLPVGQAVESLVCTGIEIPVQTVQDLGGCGLCQQS